MVIPSRAAVQTLVPAPERPVGQTTTVVSVVVWAAAGGEHQQDGNSEQDETTHGDSVSRRAKSQNYTAGSAP
jgi:hypothetical protein